MNTNNGINAPMPFAVGKGGTGIVLIPSNGGIVYSTSSTLNLLAGTATAGQALLSGATAAPTWSTPTYPSASGSSGQILISDGTNNVYSTPTFPNASATSRKIIVSDGTNWVASTETYAVPGTSGNILTSNGTNWTSAAPSGVGYSSVTVTLAQADVQGMYATPVLLLAAPGAGKVITPRFITVYINFQTSAFSAGGTFHIQYNNTVHGGGINMWSNTAATINTTSSLISAGAQGIPSTSSLTNVGIYMSNATQAFAGGSASSTIVVTMEYVVMTATV